VYYAIYVSGSGTPLPGYSGRGLPQFTGRQPKFCAIRRFLMPEPIDKRGENVLRFMRKGGKNGRILC
jgi:hypothetical protein